jgi:hypothetical protein
MRLNEIIELSQQIRGKYGDIEVPLELEQDLARLHERYPVVEEIRAPSPEIRPEVDPCPQALSIIRWTDILKMPEDTEFKYDSMSNEYRNVVEKRIDTKVCMAIGRFMQLLYEEGYNILMFGEITRYSRSVDAFDAITVNIHTANGFFIILADETCNDLVDIYERRWTITVSYEQRPGSGTYDPMCYTGFGVKLNEESARKQIFLTTKKVAGEPRTYAGRYGVLSPTDPVSVPEFNDLVKIVIRKRVELIEEEKEKGIGRTMN